MPILNWRPAVRSDRGALSVFECTTPPVKRRTPPFGLEHPRPWELMVQKWIRSLGPPALGPRVTMWVGEDAEGIGALFVYEDESGNHLDVFLKAAAVSVRHRGSGGGVADEMFAVFFDEVESRAVAAGSPETLVSGHIHRRNSNSQAAARRNGLRHTRNLTGDHEEYQLWQARLEYPAELRQLSGFPLDFPD